MSGKRVRSMSFNVNNRVDKELLRFLDAHLNKNRYIKNLIANDYMNKKRREKK